MPGFGPSFRQGEGALQEEFLQRVAELEEKVKKFKEMEEMSAKIQELEAKTKKLKALEEKAKALEEKANALEEKISQPVEAEKTGEKDPIKPQFDGYWEPPEKTD